MSQPRRLWLSCLALVCLLALPFASFAQTAVDGAIGGTVTDTTGAVISGAKVTVRNIGTNAVQKATADASGYFRIIHLAPGSYNVSIAANGFHTYRSVDLTVQVGLLTTVDAHLSVGAAAQTVQVSGAAPLVNTTSPDFSGVINQNTLNNLPVSNYRWSSYALLTPGVVNDSNGYGLLSFRGQSTLLNNVTIDGTDDNQAYFSEERGRTRAGYSTIKAAVQEFQVNTSNYSVEYGRSAGGIVNSVTKSGSNHFHGQGYYFDRDGAWAATNSTVTHPVETSTNPPTYEVLPFKPTDLRRQYGFTFGGPILKDRLFFFFAADRFYHDFPAAATITGTSANANFYNLNGAYAQTQIADVANLTGLSTADATSLYNSSIAGLTTLLGTAPRTGSQTIYFPKIDWQINSKNHLAVEANRMRWESPAGIQTSPAVAYGKESFGNDYVRDNWIVGKLDTFITPTLSNEARFMYGRDFEFEFNQQPTAYEESNLVKTSTGYTNPYGLPPNVYLSGFFQFGTPTFLNRAALPDERRWQLSDTVEWIHGNHDFKFGEDYVHTYDLISNLYDQYGEFYYSGADTLGNYVSDLYLSQHNQPAQHFNDFSQGSGLPGLDFTTGDYAVFAQDEWKAMRRLSLTLGVRWDYEAFPSPQLPNSLLAVTSHVDNNSVANISPRVGFAYDVFGTGNTVLRGGFGLFYARAINSTLYQALVETGTSSSQSNPYLYPGGSCTPTFPQIVPIAQQAACLAGSNATVDYLDPNFKVPQILQGDLTVQQQLSNSDVISLSWLGSWGRRLPDFVDTNLPKPTVVSFTVDDPTHQGPLPNGYSFNANAFFGSRPNPNFSSITDIFSGVTSNYNALVAQYQHRFSHHVSLDANYTWSHALDYGENNTTGASATALLDPTNIKLDYGNSNQNVPNRLVVYGVADSPWHVNGPLGYLVNNFELSPSLQTQTGLPYSVGISGSSSTLTVTPGDPVEKIVSTGSFNGSGGANRVPVFNRNNLQQPKTWVLDLRASKRLVVREHYSLEFLGEAFNLANHQNVTSVESAAYYVNDNTTKSGGATIGEGNTLTPYSVPFGQVTATDNSNFAYNIRQLQLGLRLQF